MMSNFKMSVRRQRYPALASCGCYTSTLNHRHLRNLEWLAKYPSVWQGYRLTESVVRNIFRMMQTCGLYSYNTSLVDATAAIRNNINRLKRYNVRISDADK